MGASRTKGLLRGILHNLPDHLGYAPRYGRKEAGDALWLPEGHYVAFEYLHSLAKAAQRKDLVIDVLSATVTPPLPGDLNSILTDLREKLFSLLAVNGIDKTTVVRCQLSLSFDLESESLAVWVRTGECVASAEIEVSGLGVVTYP